jgi:hypothetical protein
MSPSRTIRGIAIVSLTASIAVACNRKPQVPDEQTTTGEQPRAQAITAIGCLKAGLAENTFVLNTAKSEGSFETTTYQLIAPARLSLGDHVNHQVEVGGTVRAEERIASKGTVQDNPAKGTTGTPTIETTTQLDVKKLDVTSIKPISAECPQ